MSVDDEHRRDDWKARETTAHRRSERSGGKGQRDDQDRGERHRRQQPDALARISFELVATEQLPGDDERADCQHQPQRRTGR
jgi:hypothetical protein